LRLRLDERHREHPLQVKEALDVLALRPGATSVEIKEAYRDLVKVWHPDRFGTDARLREKAEDKLKEINKAYRVLQADRSGGAQASASEEFVDSKGRVKTWPSGVWSAAVPKASGARANRRSVGVGWFYGCVGTVLGLMAGYAAIEHGATKSAGPLAGSGQQVEASTQQVASTMTSPPEKTPVGPDAGSAESPGSSVRLKGSHGSNGRGASPFRVRQLSGAETDQLESACSKLKDMKDRAAYPACVKAQLDLITKVPGPRDLSALSGNERESIESVCSAAKRVRGADSYDRCLTAQMATLAAEPGRPDLSALNEVDRSSIEVACRKAKFQEGPAAYNRCRMGLVKLLAESK
jgi:DnaJ domain